MKNKRLTRKTWKLRMEIHSLTSIGDTNSRARILLGSTWALFNCIDLNSEDYSRDLIIKQFLGFEQIRSNNGIF